MKDDEMVKEAFDHALEVEKAINTVHEIRKDTDVITEVRKATFFVVINIFCAFALYSADWPTFMFMLIAFGYLTLGMLFFKPAKTVK